MHFCSWDTCYKTSEPFPAHCLACGCNQLAVFCSQRSRFCRSDAKANSAADSIKKSTGNDKVHAFGADLSSMAQVRSLAEEVKRAHPKIDVLSNNAGVFAERMQASLSCLRSRSSPTPGTDSALCLEQYPGKLQKG